MRTSFLLAVLVCLASIPWSSSNQLFGQDDSGDQPNVAATVQAASAQSVKKESYETLVYFPKTVSAQELQSALHDLVGNDFKGSIVVINSNDSLAIRLPSKSLEEAASLLNQLDKPRQLVHFKAQFVKALRKSTDARPHPAFQSISNAKADVLIEKLLSSGEYTRADSILKPAGGGGFLL
ncbi:MAG: secretin N-terminal domain-containing protein, partial [Pirellulales bacterium]